MRRRMILTDDEDDHPAAIDLVTGADVIAGVITAPAVAGLVLGHHCDGLEPSACARPFDVQPCRFISPLSADVQSRSVHPGVAGHGSTNFEGGQSRGIHHNHMSLPAAPQRVRNPEVVVISDDEVIPIAPVVVTPSPALPLNIFQHAALHGHFPSGPAPPAVVVTPHSDVSDGSVFADREALHGDSTSSGSSGSSGSELSGDFVDHAEQAFRRKDRRILEHFFPLTCKRLRLARVAPNLLASRPRKKLRADQRSALMLPIIGEFEVVD
jgi:hypothetical protein